MSSFSSFTIEILSLLAHLLCTHKYRFFLSFTIGEPICQDNTSSLLFLWQKMLNTLFCLSFSLLVLLFWLSLSLCFYNLSFALSVARLSLLSIRYDDSFFPFCWPYCLVCLLMQRTLDTTTFYGCIVDVVVCIAGFVTEKQEGNGALIHIWSLLTFYWL